MASAGNLSTRRFLTLQIFVLSSDASPCRKFGVVQQLAYPSMKIGSGRFDGSRFSQALLPSAYDIMTCLLYSLRY